MDDDPLPDLGLITGDVAERMIRSLNSMAVMNLEFTTERSPGINERWRVPMMPLPDPKTDLEVLVDAVEQCHAVVEQESAGKPVNYPTLTVTGVVETPPEVVITLFDKRFRILGHLEPGTDISALTLLELCEALGHKPAETVVSYPVQARNSLQGGVSVSGGSLERGELSIGGQTPAC